jgi:hypothetical protein
VSVKLLAILKVLLQIHTSVNSHCEFTPRFPRFVALVIVFWWSAVMHEVAVGVPFRIMKGWAFMAMFFQVGRGAGGACRDDVVVSLHLRHHCTLPWGTRPRGYPDPPHHRPGLSPHPAPQIPLITLTAYLRAKLKNDALGELSISIITSVHIHPNQLSSAHATALKTTPNRRPPARPQPTPARPPPTAAAPPGNAIFWTSFCILGQPLCILLYAHGAVLAATIAICCHQPSAPTSRQLFVLIHLCLSSGDQASESNRLNPTTHQPTRKTNCCRVCQEGGGGGSGGQHPDGPRDHCERMRGT